MHKQLQVNGQGILTPRETQITAMVAEGMQNKVIAKHLDRSPSVVKLHIEHARSKLDAQDRTHLITRAFETGVLKFMGIVLTLLATSSAYSLILDDDSSDDLRSRTSRAPGSQTTRMSRGRLRRERWLDGNLSIETEVQA